MSVKGQDEVLPGENDRYICIPAIEMKTGNPVDQRQIINVERKREN